MSPLKRLLDEIHSRSLWQVLTLYLAGGWVVLEVTATIVEQLYLPGWVFPSALVLLLIGLPILLLTAVLHRGVRSASESATSGLGKWLTWRRALWSGLLAFTLLGIGMVGFLASRALGVGPGATLIAQGALDERDRLVLGDFQDASGGELGAVAAELLRVDLNGSSAVRLLDGDELRSVLSRMGRAPGTAVTEELAREIAQREGLKAVIGGEITRVGASIVVIGHVTADDGVSLISHRETTDEAGFIDAVDRLSKRIRERLGESLGNIRASPPLERATTASLPALRLYTEAGRRDRAGDKAAASELWRRAVEIDSTFAEAASVLAVSLYNEGVRKAEQVEAVSRAHRHRERLAEPARLLVEAQYHLFRGEWAQAVDAFNAGLALDSTSAIAQSLRSDLAWTHLWLRDYEAAESVGRRVLAQDSLAARQFSNFLYGLLQQDRRAEADSIVGVMLGRFPDHPETLGSVLRATAWGGDYEETVRRTELLAGNRPDLAAPWFDRLEQVRGGFRDVADRRRGQPPATRLPVPGLREAMERATLDLPVAAEERAAIEVWVAAAPDSIFQHSRFAYPETAYSLAVVGLPAQATALLDAFDRYIPQGFLGELRPLRDLALGAIALAEGEAATAVTNLREADRVGWCVTCPLPTLARADDAAGMPDSTISVLERFLTIGAFEGLQVGPDVTPGVTPFDQGLAYERLGQLYEERGDVENAEKYHSLFVELWAEADQELQPRVAAARARLSAIAAERG